MIEPLRAPLCRLCGFGQVALTYPDGVMPPTPFREFLNFLRLLVGAGSLELPTSAV